MTIPMGQAEFIAHREQKIDAEMRRTVTVPADELPDDLSDGYECGADFVDGSYTFCGCDDCNRRASEDQHGEGWSDGISGEWD